MPSLSMHRDRGLPPRWPHDLTGGMTSGEANTAGGSAKREYDRRRAADEARIRDRWGPLGGIAVALSDERPSTTAWKTGARGEEVVGRALDRLATADPAIRILHDRRLPGSRANIDHIAVTPSGVVVVDAKRYTGRPERRVDGGFLRPGVEKLIVGRRDQTKIVDGILAQVDRVGSTLGDVPVRGALCFVDADWPLFGGSFTIRGIDVCWPGRLGRLVTGVVGPIDVEAASVELARVFRPA